MGPFITEAILIGSGNDNIMINTINVCTVLISIVSLYGGSRVAYEGRILCRYTSGNVQNDDCNRMWCGKPNQLKTLFSAGFVLYMLAPWYIVNQVSIIAHNKILNPLTIIFGSFTIPIYAFGTIIGFSIGNNLPITPAPDTQAINGKV